jgi:hypothetical protein
MQGQFGQKIRNAEEFLRREEMSNDESGISKGRSRETRARKEAARCEISSGDPRQAIRDQPTSSGFPL